MRRFLRTYPDGGSPALVIDPRSLAWVVLHDARDINQGNSTPVNSWANRGSAGGNATPPFGNPPFFFEGVTSTGQSLVQFIGSKQLHGSLSVTPMSQANGFTIAAYVFQDVVDAGSGGGLNAQSVYGNYTGTDFRMYSVIYPTLGPEVGGRTLSTGDNGTGVPSVTGAQSLALTVTPPAGASAGGSVRVYRNGVDIGGWSNWISAPNTDYNISGNGVGNICFKGSMCWVGMIDRALAPGTIKALHAFSRAFWGT
jgi:hypothetical protein